MTIKKNSLHIIHLFSPYMVALTAISVLLTFVLLGQYAHPSADDFCMATGVKHEGLFAHLWNHYFEWSGRYSGNALYAIYPLLFGMFDGLILMPALLILTLLLSCAYFLSSLFNLKITANPIILLSLCFVSIYLLGMKHTASSLYWSAGALSYQSANILLMLTLGLIIQLIDRQRQQQSYRLIVVFLTLSIMLGMGTNETNMLALSAITGIAFIVKFHFERDKVEPWLFLLFIALLSFGVVYFAPGNTIRESSFPLRHDWLRSIKGSLDMGLWVLMGWILNPLFIIASFFTPFAVSRLSFLSSRVFNISNSLLVAFIVVTLSIPFILQFPAWWAMGGWPPPRTVDAIFFVFIISWFSMLSALSLRFLPQTFLLAMGKCQSDKWTLFMFVGAIIFTLAVVLNFKFQRAQLDLWQRAAPFHDYMLNRYDLIDEAVSKQQINLLVPAFNQEYPRSIYFNDIVPDARDWRNVCYADYFGLKQISRQRQQIKSDHKVKRPRSIHNGYDKPNK